MENILLAGHVWDIRERLTKRITNYVEEEFRFQRKPIKEVTGGHPAVITSCSELLKLF